VAGELVLEPNRIRPGESFVARGRGCTPGATVTLSADRETLPPTTADDNGSFSAPITLHHTSSVSPVIVVQCGPTLRATLTILVTSGVATPITSLAVLLFLLLVSGFVLWRWSRGRAR
jgi:hypothetical protein